MDELIKRLERVIQTGAPYKNGMHPISAEAVLEVVKELSEPSTNCSEFPNNSDTISRAKAIEALDKRFASIPMEQTLEILMLRKDLRELPPAQPAQPDIIRCKDCRHYEADITGNPRGVCYHKDWIANNVGHDVDEDGWCYRAERRKE